MSVIVDVTLGVIVELRETARTALGNRFSLAEFHNRVLGAGRVPLDVLEQDIDRWIAERIR